MHTQLEQQAKGFPDEVMIAECPREILGEAGGVIFFRLSSLRILAQLDFVFILITKILLVLIVSQNFC